MSAPTSTATFRLGQATELPPGEGRAYAAGDVQVAVFRTRAGRLHAVSAVCPHAGGPIADGIVDEQVVICPLHQHTYELATGCSRTGQQSLTVYHVAIDAEGFLVVQLRPIS
jgi:nitrite reductase/ring-hydroxylating ferredoxin subunit